MVLYSRALAVAMVIGTGSSALTAPAPPRLPAPPRPPPHIMTPRLSDKLPLLSTAAALTSSLAGAAAVDVAHTAPVFAALAGVAAVPIALYQHDIMHMQPSQRTRPYELISLAATAFTGTFWSEGPVAVHRNHHAVTGDFKGALTAPPSTASTAAARALGDQDDLWLLLRAGNPLAHLAEQSELVGIAMAAASALAAGVLFQPVLLLQAARDAATKGRHDVLAALVLHLALAWATLGPLGYFAFTSALGIAFTLPSVPFHEPKGVDRTDGNYWYEVLVSTRSLDAHAHPLVRYLMNGADYHIEHHLWQDVPVENLHLLEPLAREYCEANGMPYRTVKWSDGWKESWQEGLRLTRLARKA